MAAPSPVLMIRTVPPGITEKDLETWARGFSYFVPGQGERPTECKASLLLSDRQIGFVQMENVDQAKRIMEIYQTRPEDVFIVQPASQTRHLLNLIYSDKQQIRTQPRPRNTIPTSETRILLVVLKELNATIMMDELFWIFSQFGKVEKLSSFTKNLKNQVLVQYADQSGASLAMSYLNGREISFSPPAENGQQVTQPSRGSCRLGILPSKLPQLTFRNQDQKNRDYSQINASLEWQFQQARSGQVGIRDALLNVAKTWQWRIRDFLWGEWVIGDGWLDPKQDANLQGQIPAAESQQKGIPQGQVGDCVHISKITLDRDIEENAPHMEPIGGFSAKQMWRLCGMYGRILAVKMLFKYEGTAIVQYASNTDAQNCIKHLPETALWGCKWEVKPSKNANAMHWSGADTQELDSRMCTFLNNVPPELPDHFNMRRPSESLSLWDVPDGVTEDGLSMLFEERGRTEGEKYGRVQKVVVNGDGSATVVMQTIEDAVVACSQLNGEDVVANGVQFKMKLHFVKTQMEDPSDFPRTRTVGGPGREEAAFMQQTWTM